MPLSRGADSSDYVKNLQGKKKKASFECQHCTRKFATRSHLVRHSRVHTGERRYACDYPGCEMRCSRKDNLQQHYRTHLVVNPRKANAQSSLTVDPDTTPDMAHDFSDVNTLTSPTEMKPISASNILTEPSHSTEVHGIPIGSNMSQVQTQPPPLGSSLVDNNDGPEREWSISPPPLSSAYDYWYMHGCLPHTVRNPASVSGSGSSGATSPEMSNALELAPGQGPRTYVDSPTTYYHPHSIPHGAPAANYGSYDNEGASTGMRTSFPLGTATFPSAADYQHPSAQPTSSHQRSHSHSYSLGGGNGGYHRIGYESASASPLVSHSQHHHHATGTNANGIQAQARHSYSAESYEPTAPYSSNGSRTLAYNSATSASQVAAFHAPTNSIDGHQQHHNHNMQQQQQQPQSHSSTFHHGHSHSHSADSHGGFHTPAAGSENRPVTRHGSLGTGYSIPVYPSHPHATIAYGVPVDMPSHTHGHATYGGSPVQRHSMPVSVANSPRVSTSHLHSQQSPSLVLPPIRYSDGDVAALHVGPTSTAPYGMTSMGHFANGSGWDRISVSDTRALPPQQGHMGGPNAATANGSAAGMTR